MKTFKKYTENKLQEGNKFPYYRPTGEILYIREIYNTFKKDKEKVKDYLNEEYKNKIIKLESEDPEECDNIILLVNEFVDVGINNKLNVKYNKRTGDEFSQLITPSIIESCHVSLLEDTICEMKEYRPKQVFSEEDPYGEEDWDEPVNESFFNKTFEERIEKLDTLFFENRKLAGNCRTKAMKYLKKYYYNLIHISDSFVSILMKYKYNIRQEQIDIIKDKWIQFEKWCVVTPFSKLVFTSDNEYNLKLTLDDLLMSINQTIYILTLLDKTFDIKEGIILYQENGKPKSYTTYKKEKMIYLITQIEKDKLREEQLLAHPEDPYGEEDWGE